MAYGEEEKPVFSVANLVVLSIGIVGVFGTGFLTSFKDILGSARPQDPSAPIIRSDSVETNRGSLTKLTRREINNKLAQIPVFFAVKESGAIYTADGAGYFFTEMEDAESFIKSKSDKKLKVSATTLDDAFFTLIEKKTKLGAFVEGVSALADPSAEYFLRPSLKQVDGAPSEWKTSHGTTDVPLFRIPTLAFTEESGLEFPLFTRKEDALAAFERLQASKNKGSEAADPQVQVTSLLDLVKLFSTGGFEGRALEVYPGMEAIESARLLMGASGN